MILESILGLAGGLIGNIVTGIFKFKAAKVALETKKLEFQHEKDMVLAETEAMIQESKAQILITQSKIEGEIELTDAQAFIQAQKEGNKSLFDNKWIDKLFSAKGKWQFFTLPLGMLIATLFGFVDFLRGLIRPALTIYLVGVTTWVTWMAWQIMEKNGVALSAFQAVQIFQDVTGVVTFLTISCVTYWMGDRTMNKFLTEKYGGNNKVVDEIKI